MELTGTYQRSGAYLQRNGLTLVIGTRKQPTPHKPKHYLLAQGKGLAPNRDKWISSIYPEPDCDRVYKFDYAKQFYLLEFEAGEQVAHIRKVSAH